MMTTSSSPIDAQRAKLRSIIAEKDDIERQIQAVYDELRSLGEKNNVKFEPNDPLVDGMKEDTVKSDFSLLIMLIRTLYLTCRGRIPSK